MFVIKLRISFSIVLHKTGIAKSARISFFEQASSRTQKYWVLTSFGIYWSYRSLWEEDSVTNRYISGFIFEKYLKNYWSMRIIILCGRNNIIVRFFYHDMSFHGAIWQFEKYLHLFMQISKITYTISFGRSDKKRTIIFICFTWKNLTNERRKAYNIPIERGVGVWKKWQKKKCKDS